MKNAESSITGFATITNDVAVGLYQMKTWNLLQMLQTHPSEKMQSWHFQVSEALLHILEHPFVLEEGVGVKVTAINGALEVVRLQALDALLHR